MNHLTIPKRVAALVIMLSAHALNLHAADFYACSTRLDYQQPQDPALFGRIPVNAAKVFAGHQADRADQVPRPPREGTIRWGTYADLVVNVAEGRRLVFGRATGYLPYLETPKGRFPLQAARRLPTGPAVPVLIRPPRRGMSRADRRPLAACAGPRQRRDDRGRP